MPGTPTVPRTPLSPTFTVAPRRPMETLLKPCLVILSRAPFRRPNDLLNRKPIVMVSPSDVLFARLSAPHHG